MVSTSVEDGQHRLDLMHAVVELEKFQNFGFGWIQDEPVSMEPIRHVI